MVKPITKYAGTIFPQSDPKWMIQRAVMLAQQARKGPVWLEVPLDVQCSEVS
jgi:acetolactate synthase-1/2/3 large subunit